MSDPKDYASTKVLVSGEKPSKVFTSRNYTIVTKDPKGSSGISLSNVAIDYPEKTDVEVTVEGDLTGDKDLDMEILKEIENYLNLYR